MLNKELRRSLRKDRRNRVNKVSEEIERKLEENNIVEAYNILCGWYKKFSGKNNKPSPDDLKSKEEYYTKLFSKEKNRKRTFKY